MQDYALLKTRAEQARNAYYGEPESQEGAPVLERARLSELFGGGDDDY